MFTSLAIDHNVTDGAPVAQAGRFVIRVRDFWHSLAPACCLILIVEVS